MDSQLKLLKGKSLRQLKCPEPDGWRRGRLVLPQRLHPCVADAVEEDDQTFDKFGSGDVFPASDRNPAPRPTGFREGVQKVTSP